MMIIPGKHSNPDRTLIAVAVVMLESLKRKKVLRYDELLSVVRKKHADSDVLYLPALNFLYMLGLLKYHKKSDVFEYLGAK